MKNKPGAPRATSQQPADGARLLAIFDRLAAHFGPLHWWPADTPFEVVIGAILTQNTSWTNVERAIGNLKRENCLTPRAVANTPRAQLEVAIHPAGFFRQKAERLHLFADHLLNTHHGCLAHLLTGPLDQVRTHLLSLKGVGPETADSILLYAGGRPSFVVDAYTRRLFSRLGVLGGGESYDHIRSLFMTHLPTDTDLYNEYHALIVEECKTFCRKRSPLCSDCPLVITCPSATAD